METENQILTEEIPKVRKRKLLTSSDNCWASCKVCKETGRQTRRSINY